VQPPAEHASSAQPMPHCAAWEGGSTLQGQTASCDVTPSRKGAVQCHVKAAAKHHEAGTPLRSAAQHSVKQCYEEAPSLTRAIIR